MGVVVYTTPTCGYCHQLKGYLRQQGVPFTEHDVSRDREAASEMIRLSGQQGVPVSLIDDKVVIGFDRPAIDQLLSQRAAQPAKLGVAIAGADRIAAQKDLSLPSGAYIGRVHPGSPSALAGLRPGDVIVELSGQAVHDDRDVHRIMAQVRRGQTADVRLWRDDQAIRTVVRF